MPSLGSNLIKPDPVTLRSNDFVMALSQGPFVISAPKLIIIGGVNPVAEYFHQRAGDKI